jgi:Zn-dependent protease
MFNSSYKIATVWGIPIKINSSLIILVLYVSFQWGVFYGPLLAASLLLSIALHELGHSYIALKKGCRVIEITLMFMGGAAQMESMPRKPFDEVLMAMAGPAVSLTIGLACIFSGPYIPIAPIAGVGINFIQLMGVINIGLTIFNVLPAFPMDGGRVVRAALTPKLGRVRATYIASRIGRAMAILFGIYGLMNRQWILVAVAFFIFIAADNEYKMVKMQEAYDNQTGSPFDSSPFGNFSRNIDEQWRGKDKNDEVVISPPPYRDDPDSKSDVEQDNSRDRLRRL